MAEWEKPLHTEDQNVQMRGGLKQYGEFTKQ